MSYASYRPNLSELTARLLTTWEAVGEAAHTFKDLLFAAWLEIQPGQV